MSGVAKVNVVIKPVTHADIPALVQISGDAFENDRHTQMKGTGAKPYNMYEAAAVDIERYLSAKACVVLKAVNEATGEAMGWCTWGFRGFEASEIPKTDPGRPKETGLDKPFFKDEKKDEEEKKAVEEEQDEEESKPDGVQRLEELTDADMKAWMEKFMPPGTKCMFVVGVTVAPRFQSMGVGSAMLTWGSETADRFGVFIWVHSSESAWPAYAKFDFKVVGTLDIDLDVYAPAPPKDEGPGAIWGHYVFRYMKRLPKTEAGSKMEL